MLVSWAPGDLRLPQSAVMAPLAQNVRHQEYSITACQIFLRGVERERAALTSGAISLLSVAVLGVQSGVQLSDGYGYQMVQRSHPHRQGNPVLGAVAFSQAFGARLFSCRNENLGS
jgi:hypothetical protein